MEDQPPDIVREKLFPRTLVWPMEPHWSETAKAFGPCLAGRVPELPANHRHVENFYPFTAKNIFCGLNLEISFLPYHQI